MKFEPPDEAMDERQATESKQAKAEREQMKKERAAQKERLRQVRIAQRDKR